MILYSPELNKFSIFFIKKVSIDFKYCKNELYPEIIFDGSQEEFESSAWYYIGEL